MGIAGSGHPPYPLFRQALDSGSLQRVMNIAREMPSINLEDALRILYLMRDQPNYEKAGMRWLLRLGAEGKGIDFEAMQQAAAALDALPERPESALAQLRALLRL